MGCFLLEEVTMTYEHLKGYYLIIVAIEGYIFICLCLILAIVFDDYCPIHCLVILFVGGALNIAAAVLLFLHCNNMITIRVSGKNEDYAYSVACLSLIAGMVMMFDSIMVCCKGVDPEEE